MLDHAREALEIVRGKTRADLDRDRVLNLALVRLLEIVGEAASRMPQDERALHPEIPWADIVTLRNRLIHGYDEVDFDILWQIVTNDLPPPVEVLERIYVLLGLVALAMLAGKSRPSFGWAGRSALQCCPSDPPGDEADVPRISLIRAREILDSRGNPTVEVEVWLEDGARGRASVPSGASTGRAEALELRDGDPRRYHGRGVMKAVEHVEREIAAALQGFEASDPWAVDALLMALDGTENKRRLGANAVLGVSLATARAGAASAGVPLYRYLGGSAAAGLPVPMVNILSGGIHGGGNIDFQDFMMIPLRAESTSEALQDAVTVHRAMKEVLKEKGAYQPGVADEGGYAPRLETNEAGFALMVEAFERAGLRPGEDAAIAVDVAASHFAEGDRYTLTAEGLELDSGEMIDRLETHAARYPLLSIEDGLGEEDWNGWHALTERLGSRCQLVGDDFFVTSTERLEKGIREGAANAVLVKMNQVGTITETLAVVELARRHGYRTVISARSGETEDDSLADLAVATGAGQIKVGSVTCSERLVKYNRLLRIEAELGARGEYPGRTVFKSWLSPA